ncbi:MAG: hypothetical protein WC794_06120 [Candidatus Doudnabacteria bacterium]|jgi:hypothetical protein
MEVLSKTQKIIYSLATFGVIVLFALIINMPVNKASALGLCSDVIDPTIRVDIDGQTFWGDASITVPIGSALPFTVWTYAEPSSVNSISYPGGFNTYPGPCGYLGCPGRSYTTSPINSPGTINVQVVQNCSGGTPPEASLTINIGLPASVCAINTFTCDGNATLAWGTSNCSSVSISPSVGVVSSTGNTQGTVGSSYTLTADSNTTVRTCPSPALNSVWQESGSHTMSKTVTPDQQITVPFNFSNTGESGSVLKNTGCNILSTQGIDPNSVDKPTCDNTTLTVP